MVAPVAVVIQQVPRILYATCAYAAALATTYWYSKQSAHPTSIKQEITAIEKPEPAARQINVQGNQVVKYTSSIPKTAAQKAAPARCTDKASSQSQCAQYNASQVKFRIEHVTRQLAHEGKKNLILNMPMCSTSCTLPFKQEPAFTWVPIDNGIRYSTVDGRFYVDLQIRDDSINREREENFQFCQDICKLRDLIYDYPEVKQYVTQQLQDIVQCFMQLRSHDIMEYLQGCYGLENLCVTQPLSANLAKKVEDLRSLYLHHDGTPCLRTMHAETLACDYMLQFIKWTDKQIGDLIPRSRYINNQEYHTLKADCAPHLLNYFWRWCKAFVGYDCCLGFGHHIYSRDQFRENLEACINACEKGDFKKAREFHDIYKHEHTRVFCEVISYYKKLQHKALYDEHDILRASYNDPLYREHIQAIRASSPQNKKAINQTFLVRQNIKNMMHEKWHIPEDAPLCVHDALYALLNDGGTALADISLLQERVEQIIATTPAENREQLIQAFYFCNGILREYEHHTDNVYTIKMPESILTVDATESRHQLNTLVRLLITNPEKSTEINTAIEYLGKSLNAATEAERTDYKNKFDSIYLKFAEQPEQQKTVTPPQGDDNQPSPDGKKPGKDEIEVGKGVAVGAAIEVAIEEIEEETPGFIDSVAETAKKVAEQAKRVFENFAEGRLNWHYKKHVIERAEWGKKAIMSTTKYLNKARELINSPIGGDIQGFISKNGYTFRYNVVTNEFATANPDGFIETLYKPTRGITYWKEQIDKYM
jgi:hypothetical protein